MKLITTEQVCEMLDISKSTLYRWINVKPEPDYSGAVERGNTIVGDMFLYDEKQEFENFPKPFKLGRSYKWDQDEILDWIKTKRVK